MTISLGEMYEKKNSILNEIKWARGSLRKAEWEYTLVNDAIKEKEAEQ